MNTVVLGKTYLLGHLDLLIPASIAFIILIYELRKIRSAIINDKR